MNLDKRLLHRLRQARAQFALAIAASALAGLLIVGQAYTLAQIISRAFLDGASLSDLNLVLVGLASIIALRAALTWLSDVTAHAATEQIKADLRDDLLAHITALGPAFVSSERSGELVTTALNGIEELTAYISEYIPQLFLALIIPLGMLAIVFPVDALSGLVLLVTAPLVPFFMILIGVAAGKKSRQQWAQLSRMSAHFLDVLQGLPTLKIFGRSQDQITIIRSISDRFSATTMSVLRIAFLSALALELLATISTAIIAVEIGLRLLYSRIVFSEALFLLILAPEFYLPLRTLGLRFHAGMNGLSAAERIFAILETPLPDCQHDSQDARQPHREPTPSDTLSQRGSGTNGNGKHRNTPPLSADTGPSGPYTIRFEAVHYAYADGERPALNGFTGTLTPGHTTALVGPSGAGKSTVAALLLRFIAPAGGRVTVNTQDLCCVPAAWWRSQIGWVPQSPHLFAGSVADNIRLGNPAAPMNIVIDAAHQAHADDFIQALPHGYDTPIGERGIRLSGGQAQRLALARAFLKDAPLLVLDEATSNLDPDTEALIMDAMHTLMRGRTTLIIAHRLRTVERADTIVVMDAGRAVETGHYHQLIARHGLFARLVNADQASAFPLER